MKNSKTNIMMVALLLVVMAALCPSASAAQFANEKLRYVISYKWGLIHKDAGEATLSLHRNGSNYSIMLAARTKPWADKFFQVRDTLLASVRAEGFKPLSYQKISHEGGKYGKDDIRYSYSGNTVTGHCTRYRDKKGKVSKSSKTLTAQGDVFDMLSIFYYLRLIDYSRLKQGHILRTTLFSGSKVETVSVRSLGVSTIKMRNGTKREAYHIRFNFTTKGKKKSSDDMDTWISTDSSHVPLMLVGQLPVGQVKCYLL
ncbi:MAG: DUF3108 domain-containing protein [Muribaculaceae bacterium]|nr:DUF3108 domain-containing protein [Muribaculaceae bacterium]